MKFPEIDTTYRAGVGLIAIMARVSNCRFRFCPCCNSKPSDFLKCREGGRFVKACEKASVRGFGAPQLLVLHQAAAIGAPRLGQFRMNRIWVGRPDDHLSFVASHIDVRSHVRELRSVYEALSFGGRAILAMYMMTILHPFEDGNGRTMRALLLSLGIEAENEFIAFIAIFSKFNQLSLVFAVNLLADGELQPVEQFLEKAASFYMGLLNGEEGGLRSWLLNLVDGKIAGLLNI
ncbi:Fic family protein [Xanthomonas arboricola]|uniref:Fic family protein n=1 Tax=Xanthomonas arboricola TaxID=56448 RepID=UPI0040408E68